MNGNSLNSFMNKIIIIEKAFYIFCWFKVSLSVLFQDNNRILCRLWKFYLIVNRIIFKLTEAFCNYLFIYETFSKKVLRNLKHGYYQSEYLIRLIIYFASRKRDVTCAHADW